MTKEEFVEKVVESTSLSRRDASVAVDVFLESMADALKRGEEIELTGIGKFSSRPIRFKAGASSWPLDEAADELREEAEQLGREHEDFLQNIARSQQTLKEIAQS